MALKYDLLLSGGEVIDPSQDIHDVRDVAFREGKVAALEPDIPREEAREVVDVSGKLVTPGLVDVHGHYFKGIMLSGIEADRACLPNGVTTSVDAGSSGWLHFDGFKEYVLSRQETRLYAFINLSAMGMYNMSGDFGPSLGVSGGPQSLFPSGHIGELQDLRFAQVDEAVRCIRENPNVVLGVKVRIDMVVTGEANALPCLERAVEVAEATGSFIMVHVARSPLPLDRIFDMLRPGDIVTHCFHTAENNVLDESGQVRPHVMEAKAKGIVLDTGAVRSNFGVDLSRAAIQQGLLPDTLGTDIVRTTPRNPVVYTMPDVMTMFMGLGMSLEQVVAAATDNGAKAIGQQGVLGTLRAGAIGDAAVLRLEEGEYAYDDSTGAAVMCGQRISPVLTVKDGRIWTAKEN